MKNHLFRDRAPVTEAGWVEIEKEAKRTLRGLLAARRVVDFKGPLGWDDPTSSWAAPILFLAAPGRRRAGSAPPHPAAGRLRIPFDVSRAELDAIDRGARIPISIP